MSLPDLLLTNALMIGGLTLVLWLVSVRIKNVSIVDLFWGTGFVIIAGVSLVQSDSSTLRGWLLTVLCAMWGLRLSVYLGMRNHRQPEDYRYAEMRARRGRNFWWSSLFIVFWLQGAVMWIISLPLQVGISSVSDLNWLNFVGVVLWSIGFVFETVGDYQLAKFKRLKKIGSLDATVMDKGLWRYTRHPNYFGNALIWWGLTLIAMEITTLWLVISPVLMTFLLLKVSGVAMLERSLSNRSSDYRDYMVKTSSFFPLPPRAISSGSSS